MRFSPRRSTIRYALVSGIRGLVQCALAASPPPLYCFTAPAVSPSMNWLWKMKYRMITGRENTTSAAARVGKFP